MVCGNFGSNRATHLFKCFKSLSTFPHQPVFITAKGGFFIGDMLGDTVEGEAEEALVEDVGLWGGEWGGWEDRGREGGECGERV